MNFSFWILRVLEIERRTAAEAQLEQQQKMLIKLKMDNHVLKGKLADLGASFVFPD